LKSEYITCELGKQFYIQLPSLISFEEVLMPQLYSCEDQLCQYDQDLDSHDVLIEHLRKKHKLSFIKRPYGLGSPDRHGHVWYCFRCETKTGKDHRRFQSDKAMWEHLNRCHDNELDKINLEQWAQVIDIKMMHRSHTASQQAIERMLVT